MTPPEVQKLLGGYATGTLTEAEQQALFEAALHDQALFDALAREESLRDLLRDPAARAHLLASLEPPAPRRFWTWRPVAAFAAMAALATVAAFVARRPRPVVLVSQVIAPAANAPVVPPPPQPEPAKPVEAKRVRVSPPVARPAAPLPEPVSGAIVEAPKVEAAKDGAAPKADAAAKKAEERVEVTAAAPAAAPQMLSTRTNLVAQDLPVAAAPQFRMQTATPGARQIFFGAAQRTAARALGGIAGAPAQPVNSLAVRYSILRRDPSGVFAEVDRADLQPSDTVELRFTANTTGFLTIGDATPVSLTAMEPYTTPALSLPAELKVIFSPQPQRQAAPAAAITEVQYRDTYVANRAPGQPVTFTVKLP